MPITLDVHRLPLPGLARPLRVVHLTDLHLPERRIGSVIKTANALRPDLVALTGDFVGHSRRPLPALTEALSRLVPPAFAVLGNHDHRVDTEAVSEAIRASGVTLLRNTSTHLGELTIVGLDDAVTDHDDVVAATAGAVAPILALSHDPRAAPALWAAGCPVVLSGHTHGGHIDLGRLTERALGHRFVAGLVREHAGVVYVCPGIGAAVWPWRVGRRSVRTVGLLDLVPPDE